MMFQKIVAKLLLIASTIQITQGFVSNGVTTFGQQRNSSPATALGMGVDMVTYLRTEWVSAALLTNQIPRSFDSCLQLGTNDGRVVQFIPRTMRKLITSSAAADGVVSVSARRQLQQQNDRRKAGLALQLIDQRADDLSEIEDESVDCVVSLLAAQEMLDNGLDWQKALIEATRVLKPGGRFLFVEQANVNGYNYVDVVNGLTYVRKGEEGEGEEVREKGKNQNQYMVSLTSNLLSRKIVFEEVGFDPIDLTLVPHIAGVAIKAEDAGLSKAEKERREREKVADKSTERAFAAFERGRKKKKKSKQKNSATESDEA